MKARLGFVGSTDTLMATFNSPTKFRHSATYRHPNGGNTNNNFADFRWSCQPTPGQPNQSATFVRGLMTERSYQ